MRLIVLLLLAAAAHAQPFDVVLAGGRVMDPETGLDAVRYVGLRGDRIAAVSETPLEGATTIDVTGLVVAPGFIDLHAHGQTNPANAYQARDGVTTALELESGVADVAEWLARREGDAILNFGATVSHGGSRLRAMPNLEAIREKMRTQGQQSLSAEEERTLTQARYEPVTKENMATLYSLLEKGLHEGALGIGMAHGYFPGANNEEIFRVFEFAAPTLTPIFTHVRGMNVDAMQEVIADAAATGTPLHIVHVNSMSLGNIQVVLDLIGGAQKRGVDVTTEAYPYTAASTNIASTIFDPGWRDRLGMTYHDVQVQDTGERLNAQTFDLYRSKGGTVIMHMMKPEWIEIAMRTPFVMVASDGMPYAPGAHPRSAGTFSRVLGRYVREEGVLGLMEALGKMTIMPAKRLEIITPQAKRKGRLQAGADADITIFDAAKIVDTATFEDDLSYSVGVRHVFVNGQLVVKDGETVEGAKPGRAVLGRFVE
ncbi:MAG: amidohydrolase family protein [Bryobacterales bacterium]|nr:amidohydrolase family protein [Bryobacterales bacterium]